MKALVECVSKAWIS